MKSTIQRRIVDVGENLRLERYVFFVEFRETNNAIHMDCGSGEIRN
jgi:hypothetical protein